MALRHVVDSVEEVSGPPTELGALERKLRELRERYPGAIVERYLDAVPVVHRSAFVAPGATIIGAVTLAEKTSVWPGVVLRGDVNRVEIRERSNLQDGAVVHLGDDDPTFVAEDVVVGHRAVLHGCHVGGGSLVGIQATVLDGAVIGEGSIIAACALVPPGMKVPPRSVVMGVPGKVVKTLTAEDEVYHRKLAGKYTRLAHNYRVG